MKIFSKGYVKLRMHSNGPKETVTIDYVEGPLAPQGCNISQAIFGPTAAGQIPHHIRLIFKVQAERKVMARVQFLFVSKFSIDKPNHFE